MFQPLRGYSFMRQCTHMTKIELPTPLLTRDEAATLLRIDVRTLDRWAREGRISSIRLSAGAIRFTPDAVAELIAASASPPRAA